MKKFTEAYLKLEKDPSLNHILMIIIFFACEKKKYTSRDHVRHALYEYTYISTR